MVVLVHGALLADLQQLHLDFQARPVVQLLTLLRVLLGLHPQLVGPLLHQTHALHTLLL